MSLTRPRLLRAALLALMLGGCDGSYPLAPTPCDDFCGAEERGNCNDDDPADCVRDCEINDGAIGRSRCAEAWSARNRCLLGLDASAFTCRDDRSHPPAACLDERRALSECLAPGSGACFDECVRQAASCGAELTDCESACSHPSPRCAEAANDYNRCIAGYPVECREPFAPDPRPPEQIPCFSQALTLLACAEAD